MYDVSPEDPGLLIVQRDASMFGRWMRSSCRERESFVLHACVLRLRFIDVMD